MPTYEYRCESGHTFEQFQKISDAPIEVCPQCGATSERILSGGAGLLFKGSGFYITDYRSDTYKKAAESDQGGASGASGTSPAKDGGASGASGTRSAKDGGTSGGSAGSTGG